MEKKTIFLELPSEMIDKIDRQNVTGDRSLFISDLLNKQLEQAVSEMDVTTELKTRMDESLGIEGAPGEINLTNNKGMSLGKFNINTIEGFNQLAEKICEISDDPIVRMRARRLR